MAIPLTFYRLSRNACLLFILQACISYSGRAQSTTEIALPDEAVKAFVDRPGDLYIQLKNKRLLKFSKEGRLLGECRLKEEPVVFEPRDGSRTFAYYRGRNLAGFAGFGTEPSSSIKEEFAIEPWLACSAGDQGMWLLDRADFSLKRVNLSSQKTEVEFSLPRELQSDTVHMREYQGFLFLQAGRNQLAIFNGFGKLLKKITGQQVRYFNFIGEELYYADNDRLHFYDLFDGTGRIETCEPGSRFILLTDEARFVVYPNRITILRY